MLYTVAQHEAFTSKKSYVTKLLGSTMPFSQQAQRERLITRALTGIYG